MDDLNVALGEIARAPLLLVASDFDGTIAPIVSNPAAAEADRESLVAIKALADMPQTHVAIVSGRALADLASRTVEAEGVHLVGSHGSEFEAGFASALTSQARETRKRLIAELGRLARTDENFLLEEKPAGAAFHFRNVPEETARPVIQAVLEGPGQWPGVFVRQGKKVIELSVVETNKGVALKRLRQRLGTTAVLFFGDDLTDEDAFATLTGPDVGIKVGNGETCATYRLRGTIDVARVLATLVELRSAWLAGSEAIPIEQHALLSDQRTMALVNPQGRVVWLCLPRLDSAALFAELVGGATAGFFEVRPAEGSEPGRQSYLPDSCVLRTEWPGLVAIDYLDCAAGRAFQRAGRTDLIRTIEGHGRIRITFAPRPDFGRIEARLRIAEEGLEIEGSLDPIVLRSPGMQWRLIDEGRHQTAVAEVELNGRPLVLELRYGTGNLAEDIVPEPIRRERNLRFWSNWAHSLTIPPVASDLVRRSALTLRALIYGPTGAISAAATTSLPEHAGGVRNWDYRFCWPRDAAMAATALVRLGAAGPAMRYLDWVLGIQEHAEISGMLRPVYTVTGGHLGPEAQVTELAGYLGSRPVRIGNMAGQQVQLDVFGPIADLLAALAERGAALSSEHWRMLEKIVASVEERWREPDHGIWEIRLSRQHYVHSKIMCWQTVDRALRVARYMGKKRPAWAELRDAIAEDVLTHGYRPECNAFCAVYGGCEADAATLAIGLSGLLPPDDPRFIGTVDYVEKHLCTDNTVYRYRYDDGLPGIEGSFLLCTSWLIEACVLCGRMKRAWELFDALCAKAGPTGLIAEEWDPEHRRSLGNYPQAYSHLGLINAAVRLTEAGR